MGVQGETDLATILTTLDVDRRPGLFASVACSEPTAEMIAAAHAVVAESESTTLVLAVDDARRFGFEVEAEFAWLSLSVHSSLLAVGLTAAFSTRLGEHAIACNVIAGYHHDHLLVPADRAVDAVAVLRSLRAG